MKKLVSMILVCLALPLATIAAQTPLPSGYGSIRLGMTVEEVKEALKKNGQFGYRGDRDVSLLPGENRVIIETDTSKTAPYSFLDRCWFQFYEDRLYIITINIKTEKMDHHSVFSALCEKYGLPQSLNPSKSEWTGQNVIMTLERPLSIKYTDRQVFEELQNKVQVEESVTEQSREHFLEGL
ncbi:MAG TPA: hypothetical protein DCM57_01135 [Treponema sp.]|nr:hypothetical protein [Treponema sp.]